MSFYSPKKQYQHLVFGKFTFGHKQVYINIAFLDNIHSSCLSKYAFIPQRVSLCFYCAMFFTQVKQISLKHTLNSSADIQINPSSVIIIIKSTKNVFMEISVMLICFTFYVHILFLKIFHSSKLTITDIKHHNVETNILTPQKQRYQPCISEKKHIIKNKKT